MNEFSCVTRFVWDASNRKQNLRLNGVTWWEVEEVFFHSPILVGSPRSLPTVGEPLRHALGRTRAGRRLHLVFALRNGIIRAVSARDMKRKERSVYANATRDGGSRKD